MARSMWLSIIVLAAVTSVSRAPQFIFIPDDVDDSALVYALWGQKPVKEFVEEIEALEKSLLAVLIPMRTPQKLVCRTC
jgi:hypothetical protein